MKYLLPFCFLLLPLGALAQNPVPEKERLIRKLMQVSKVFELARYTMDATIEGQRKVANPNLPEGFWEEFKKEITDEKLYELYVPIFSKHYTEEDLKGLITFYETPLGQKMVQNQPLVMQEASQAGEQLGAEIAMKVYTKLKKE
ncbi:DUF2059 domain-containing protein [Siphonobacter sp.]|uniref:DUF2059 domain-containing protein n=1 Tax=Siphonobacter sp. TaxID=1869184 RepID=UPI003B3BE0FE